jgi:hypothetical protein
MNCDQLERVALAMDGEFTAEVEAHVASCAECASLLEDRELLRTAPVLSEFAVTDVQRRVRERIRGSRARTLRWLAAAAAMLFAATSLFLLERQPMTTAQPVEMARHETKPSSPAQPEALPRAVDRSTMRRARPTPVAKPKSAEPPSKLPDPVRLAQALRHALGPETTAPVSARPGTVVTLQTDNPEVLIILIPAIEGDVDE